MGGVSFEIHEKRILDLKEIHEKRILDLKESHQKRILDLKNENKRLREALKDTKHYFLGHFDDNCEECRRGAAIIDAALKVGS